MKKLQIKFQNTHLYDARRSRKYWDIGRIRGNVGFDVAGALDIFDGNVDVLTFVDVIGVIVRFDGNPGDVLQK